ncbi:hypothetical protein VXQ18_05100 [Brucella abortus]|nr:hypothetical protein [Brucella abortus]
MADAFDEVQRAEQDEDRFVEESNQYSNQKLGQARGEAAQLREEAAAYRTVSFRTLKVKPSASVRC